MTDSKSVSPDRTNAIPCCRALAVCKQLGSVGILVVIAIALYAAVVSPSDGPAKTVKSDNKPPASDQDSNSLAAVQEGSPGDTSRKDDLRHQTAASDTVAEKQSHSEPSQDGQQFPAAPEVSETGDLDRKYQELIVGTWEDDYQGKRVMEIRDDGTATMDVYLSGLKATLFAAHLKFNMKWSIQDARLRKQTIGGEPSGKVNLILKTMGDRVDEPILELTSEHLQLLDGDGKTKYDWRRVQRGSTDSSTSGRGLE